jgi:hypothetical protein
LNRIDFSENLVSIPEFHVELYVLKRPDDSLEKLTKHMMVTNIYGDNKKTRVFTDENITNARRNSYGLYGDVPIVDSYDETSIILGIWVNRSSFFTLRGICPHEKGLEDLKHNEVVFKNGNTSRLSELPEVIESRDSIGSISRLAKLPGGKAGENDIAFAFAFAQLMIAEQFRVSGVKYVTCQSQRVLIDRITAFTQARQPLFFDEEGNPNHQLGFVSAKKGLEEYLNITGIEKVRLDRKQSADYILHYPGYFLDVTSFKKVLAEYLGEDFVIPNTRTTIKDLDWKSVKLATALLFQDDKIIGMHGSISPKKIKNAILDQELVPDAVSLYFMDIEKWDLSVREKIERFYRIFIQR